MTYSTLKSYVRRQGRITTGQKWANAHYWKDYGIEWGEKEVINQHNIFSRDAPCIIEIGVGMGESFIETAIMHPEINFIGVEVHLPGVGRCLHQIHTHRLGHVKMVRDDVTHFLMAVPVASVDEVRLFFPDPWPKGRHHKRRLVQPTFVAHVAETLKPGGRFHLATDWAPYAEHMLAVLENCVALENCFGKGQFATDRLNRVKTKYERRGEAKGHRIFDLIYQRSSIIK